MSEAKTIRIKGSLLNLSEPKVMGIVNITPDSFFADSRVRTETQIIERVGQLLADGADIIDIGAQSSNPSSPFLSSDEEMLRLRTVLPKLRSEFPNAIFSVDTFYADVARIAVQEGGVDIINDVSGGLLDGEMFRTVADLSVPYVLMHMRGTPQTMQNLTDYNHLLQDILLDLSHKVEALRLMGVADIIIDPGFGFSKTLEQNYQLMASLKHFRIFDMPLLVGVSRKSMIYRMLDITPEESLTGTTALNMYALCAGTNILRVHDVKEAVQTVRIFNELQKSEKQQIDW